MQEQQSLRRRNTLWLETRLKSAIGSPVLVADDSEADIFFLLRALAAARVKNPIFVVRSGAEAIQYLSGSGRFADGALYPRPGIVFIDLKMPGLGGIDVLRWKNNRPDLNKTLWVALSNFDTIQNINDAYRAGATTFLSKPLHADDIRNLVAAFDTYWRIRRPEPDFSFPDPQ